jgi:hypothetical protein
MEGARTNGSSWLSNQKLSSMASSQATPFPLKKYIEVHIRNTNRKVIDPLSPQEM